jgi:hypothetical protein
MKNAKADELQAIQAYAQLKATGKLPAQAAPASAPAPAQAQAPAPASALINDLLLPIFLAVIYGKPAPPVTIPTAPAQVQSTSHSTNS